MTSNRTAVQQANERLWTAHPELGGRQLTLEPVDASLRREWMRYYREASALPLPPPPSRAPVAAPEWSFPPEPPSPVASCENQCKDDSGRICPCRVMTTITIYVQKGESPVSIVGSYLWDKITQETPQPDTGHTFIGIGEGSLSDQKAFGFYPVKSWFDETGGINTNEGFFVPGEANPITDVYPPENEHAFTHKKSFKACPDAVAKLEEAIQKDIESIKSHSKDAPKYDLTDLQCTTWARKNLRDLGFEDPGGFSPYGAAEGIDETGKSEAEKSASKTK